MYNIRQKMDYAARMTLPGLVALLLMLLFSLPIRLAGLADFTPDICLISIYYWSIFRPGTMPYWFVFLLGLVRDSIAGIALGMSSLVFILFRLFILSQQRYFARETFWANWFGFGIAASLALAVGWVIAVIYARALFSIDSVGMQWVFTFGLYPLLHILFNKLYRYLPQTPGGIKNRQALRQR